MSRGSWPKNSGTGTYHTGTSVVSTLLPSNLGGDGKVELVKKLMKSKRERSTLSWSLKEAAEGQSHEGIVRKLKRAMK